MLQVQASFHAIKTQQDGMVLKDERDCSTLCGRSVSQLSIQVLRSFIVRSYRLTINFYLHYYYYLGLSPSVGKSTSHHADSHVAFCPRGRGRGFLRWVAFCPGTG